MSTSTSIINKKEILIENNNQLNNLIKEIFLEILEEKKKKKKSKKRKPGNPNYYKGTRKSNKEMEREINKCAKEPRPKSCYKDWSADKTYRKSKNTKYMSEDNIEYYDDLVLKELTLENESYVDNILERKKKKKKKKSKKLSKRTRETLKKKADKANMPLGALTSVYRKGLAAWLTGHRQGVAQHQWAMARVNSFIRGGKTRSVDKSEWKRVQNFRKRKK
jgi:DNA mismatch repair ATPase MutL